MNALFFYAAVGLMVGGGVLLQVGVRGGWRTIAYAVLAAGIGVLAAGLHAWIVLGASLLLLAWIALAPLVHRRQMSRSARADQNDPLAPTLRADKGRVKMNDVNEGMPEAASSPLRKGVAALLSAAIAGILLSIIWTNPLWKIKTPAEQNLAVPGIGSLLLILLLLLLVLFSRRSIAAPTQSLGESQIPETRSEF